MNRTDLATKMGTKLSKNGQLVLNGLPFRKGEQVEVIILAHKQNPARKQYPLRKTPIVYRQPFDSVAESEWMALQ
jgi:hypothetical protein